MSQGILHVVVEAVEVCGPGLTNWTAAGPILAGAAAYCAGPIVLEPPAQLSPAERRRVIPSVKLALAVGMRAVAQSGYDPCSLPVVFTSSGADGETISAILSTLTTANREVSPTRFHNSVHNAPSGYWGVAMQSREAVTSLSGYDASFAAGLLEAAVQAVFDCRPVLLIAYDLPYPEPLHSARPIAGSFAAAFVLSPSRPGDGIAQLSIRLAVGEATCCSDPVLEQLRQGNPAARSLPLLAMLATGARGTVHIDLSHGAIDIGVKPC